MKTLMAVGIALGIVAAGPGSTGAALDLALANYKAMLMGQRQLADLSLQERLDVIKLDHWLKSQDGIKRPETKRQCKERLASRTPSRLEEALLDLKCSQRPTGRSGN